MRNRRLLGLAAAGVGAAAAALGTGVVVERRIVQARRAATEEADRLGALRGDRVEVLTDDGLVLHAEVDEVAPYRPAPAGEAGGRRGRPGRRGEPPAPPTLVLVHGYALNLDCWHFQRAHFRGKRRMVLFDLRSHGRSPRSPREHATVDQLGHDLARVLEQVVPDGPVVLVGHSMGGMALMAFAEHYPDVFERRVVGTALISTTAGGIKPHRVLSTLIPDRIGSTLGPRLVAGLARAPELVDSARRRGSNIGFVVTDRFAFGTKVPRSYVEFVDEMLAGTPFDVLAEFFPNFESLDKFTVLRRFAAVPTVVVGGTGDLLTSIGHSRKMADRIRGARLVEIPAAGHMVIMERAEQVNAALDDLLAEVDRSMAQKGAS